MKRKAFYRRNFCCLRRVFYSLGYCLQVVLWVYSNSVSLYGAPLGQTLTWPHKDQTRLQTFARINTSLYYKSIDEDEDKKFYSIGYEYIKRLQS
jgi:hypothetical protein